MLEQLGSSSQGLGEDEARTRLAAAGPNHLRPKTRTRGLTLFLAQFKSPIILILFFAAGLSIFLGDHADAIIILAIVLVSGFLGFWQERGAARAVEKLLAMVQIKAMVRRQGEELEVPAEEIVPGTKIAPASPEPAPLELLPPPKQRQPPSNDLPPPAKAGATPR